MQTHQDHSHTKTLLVVIDFINDIADKSGKLGGQNSQYIAEHNVIENVNKAIGYARGASIKIAHVKVGFSPSYIECPCHSPIFGNAKKTGALQLNTWGTDFLEAIDVHRQDFIVIKHRVSALYNTNLTCVLTANRINNIIIAGISTDMAVEATSRDAHDQDYRITVLEDACAAADSKRHQASINNLARIARVQTVDQWING